MFKLSLVIIDNTMKKIFSIISIFALILVMGAGCGINQEEFCNANPLNEKCIELGGRTQDSGQQKKDVSGDIKIVVDDNVTAVDYQGADLENVGSMSIDIITASTTITDTLTVNSLVTSPLVISGSATTTIYGDGTQSTIGGAIDVNGSLMIQPLGTATVGTTVYNSPDFIQEGSGWDTAPGVETIAGITQRFVPTSGTTVNGQLFFYATRDGVIGLQVASMNLNGTFFAQSFRNSSGDYTVAGAGNEFSSIGNVADGGTSHKFGNLTTLTSGKIASFYSDNQSTEKAYIGYDGTGSFDGNLIVKGANFRGRTAVGAADYNPSALTDDYIIGVDNTAAARAVTISTEDVATGSTTIPRFFVIKDESINAGTNNITVTLESGGTIDGEASYVMDSDGQSITLYIDGTNASII